MPRSWGDNPHPAAVAACLASETATMARPLRPRARCQTCGTPIDPAFTQCGSCALPDPRSAA